MTPEEADIVAVGFGPANAALAVALDELSGVGQPSAVFLERQQRFGWHRGMLLPGATIQISFLKDLASLRNPCSAYSFVSYLHERDRLADFINGNMRPTRCEFHDYLEWVADRVPADVRYGATARTVHPVWRAGRVTHVDVAYEDAVGHRRTIRARSLVLGMGLEPWLPPGVEPTDRIFHSDDLLVRLAAHQNRVPSRTLVIGAGQSAAEVTRYVHAEFPQCEVVAVIPSFGYAVADDTPFVNRVFDPASTGMFHDARATARHDILRRHANTNYSVVDRQLIDELYQRVYHERVAGTSRLQLRNLSRIRAARQVGTQVETEIHDAATGSVSHLAADLVVCATGYRPFAAQKWLAEFSGQVRIDDEGVPLVDRDYRVRTDDAMTADVYLQGPTEVSHGLSSTLLSTVAVRAGEILAAIMSRAEAPSTRESAGAVSPLTRTPVGS